MIQIETYLDSLFADCPDNRRMTARRAALSERLEKRYAGFRGQGMSEADALSRTIEGLPSAPVLTGSVQRIDSMGYRMELTQIGLVYCVIGWVVSMPMRLFGSMVYVNELMMMMAIAVGIYYAMTRLRKKSDGPKETHKVEWKKLRRRSLAAWIIWSVLAVAWIAVFIALRSGEAAFTFGEFYASGKLLCEGTAPLLTVFIPMLMSAAARLTDRYEVFHEG